MPHSCSTGAVRRHSTDCNREDRLGDIPRRSVRRTAPDGILIANTADLAVGEIDLDHVLRRADQDQGLVGVSVEYISVASSLLLLGRDIG
jgi:hypothetical protein